MTTIKKAGRFALAAVALTWFMGASGYNVGAKVRTGRARVVRQVRQARRRRARKRQRELRRLAPQGSRMTDTIRRYLLRDLDQARATYGLRKLVVTPMAQRAADYRDPRVSYAYSHYNGYLKHPSPSGNPTDAWVHGAWNHTDACSYLTRRHATFTTVVSDASGWCRGTSPYSYNSDRTPYRFDNDTPKGIAANIINNYLNHDMAGGNDNAHRRSLLGRRYRYVGIGVTYDPKTNLGTDNIQLIY